MYSRSNATITTSYYYFPKAPYGQKDRPGDEVILFSFVGLDPSNQHMGRDWRLGDDEQYGIAMIDILLFIHMIDRCEELW